MLDSVSRMAFVVDFLDFFIFIEFSFSSVFYFFE